MNTCENDSSAVTPQMCSWEEPRMRSQIPCRTRQHISESKAQRLVCLQGSPKSKITLAGPSLAWFLALCNPWHGGNCRTTCPIRHYASFSMFSGWTVKTKTWLRRRTWLLKTACHSRKSRGLRKWTPIRYVVKSDMNAHGFVYNYRCI